MADQQAAQANVNDSTAEKDRWQEFVTQTDWQGPVMQESWYGHHNPCRRMALFVHFSSIISTIVLAFQILPKWPILHPSLSASELDRIKQSHANCATAICNTVYPITMDCSLMPDGQIAMENLYPSDVDRVPLPEECHDALRLSFGEDSQHMILQTEETRFWTKDKNDKDSNMREIDLIHFGDFETSRNIPIFKFLKDECLVEESLLAHLFLSDLVLLDGALLIDVVEPSALEPGKKTHVRLRTFACPEHMSRWMQREILPKSKQLYDFFLFWRRSGTISLIYWYQMAYHSAMSASRIFFVLVPGVVIWLILPKKEVRGKGKSLFSTIATLLLLTTLAEEGKGGTDEAIRTGILVCSAILLGNQKAALEWSFLYFLSYMDLRGLEIEYLGHMDSIRIPRFFEWLLILVWFLIPGDGFWMLVTIYVVYMAFPTRHDRRDVKRD